MDPKMSQLDDCTLMALPKVHNRQGNLTAINGDLEVPFSIQRVYYLYDIPGGAERGGHAHRQLQQLIVAAGGSFDVLLHDGQQERKVTLNQPYQGLLLVPGIWRELVNFSSGAVCLVLASRPYAETDYIRDWENFKMWKHAD